MKKCLFIDNEVDYINGEGDEGVEVNGGRAIFEETYILYNSEEYAKCGFNEERHFEPVYDPEKEEWCIRLKD